MTARAIIDSTKRSADLLYLARFNAPDPVIWVEIDGQRALILSELELDRARETAAADLFLPSKEYYRKAGKDHPAPTHAHVLGAYLAERGIGVVEVPATFPVLYDRLLASLGVEVKVCEGPFVPERRRKGAQDARTMAEAVRMAAEGIATAVGMIGASAARGAELFLDGRPLTSQWVKAEVGKLLLERGYRAADLIVAGVKEQTCLPHHSGNGPLKAGEAIILDFFPRDAATGYHGDVTRTVVKGEAPPRIRQMHEAARRVEREMAARLRPGAECSKLHEEAVGLFDEAGFPTGREGGRAHGFFHGLGHGLGLEVHETPHFSTPGEVFKEGDIVTLEPGLYYPDAGGVRHENVYRITEDGARCLHEFEVPFEI